VYLYILPLGTLYSGERKRIREKKKLEARKTTGQEVAALKRRNFSEGKPESS
jgi:hypothetical protein